MNGMEAHGTGLLSTLVVSLVFTFLGGVAARAARLPRLVGYLLAGVAVGPFTPGFVAYQRIASELAEIGVAPAATSAPASAEHPRFSTGLSAQTEHCCRHMHGG